MYILPTLALFPETQDIHPVILARGEPVLVSLAHASAEFLVQCLAGPRTRMSVNAFEIARDAADKRRLQNGAITFPLVLAQNRVRVAVNCFGIARETHHVV